MYTMYLYDDFNLEDYKGVLVIDLSSLLKNEISCSTKSYKYMVSV